MSKGNGAHEKVQSTATPSTEHKPTEHKAAEHKTSHGDKAESGKKSKKHEPIEGSCFATDCKSKSARFNFCTEHFDHFKFGLISKTGEQVSDYEKKIEHFHAYKSKQSARKVA